MIDQYDILERLKADLTSPFANPWGVIHAEGILIFNMSHGIDKSRRWIINLDEDLNGRPLWHMTHVDRPTSVLSRSWGTMECDIRQSRDIHEHDMASLIEDELGIVLDDRWYT